MKRLFTGVTDRGLLRLANQDAYHIDASGRFFVVADGMGGHAGGQEASRIATETIRDYLEANLDSGKPPCPLLEGALQAANQAILKEQHEHPECSDMGTTVVIVLFDGDQPWCAHIGDSRLYRLRGPKLEQITEDHTWIARALKHGEVSPDQARSHPWRHVLAQCLGRENLDPIDIKAFDFSSGDRLLLCSDGLTEELSDHLIAAQLKSIRSCEKAATALVDAAKDRGGRDNITVVIVALDALS